MEVGKTIRVVSCQTQGQKEAGGRSPTCFNGAGEQPTQKELALLRLASKICLNTAGMLRKIWRVMKGPPHGGTPLGSAYFFVFSGCFPGQVWLFHWFEYWLCLLDCRIFGKFTF